MIALARIVQDERFGVMKQQDAAQKILSTDIPDEIRTRAMVTGRNAEMMIGITTVLRDVRTRAGEREDAGFPVMTDLVIDQGRPAVWAVDDNAREDSFSGPAFSNRTGGVQDVYCRVLIAADITESDAADSSARYPL